MQSSIKVIESLISSTQDDIDHFEKEIKVDPANYKSVYKKMHHLRKLNKKVKELLEIIKNSPIE